MRAACRATPPLPLNRTLVPPSPPLASITEPSPAVAGGVPWTMMILADAFGATRFVSAALVAHRVRLLEAVGATPAIAVSVGALIGPAQVAARVAELSFFRRTAPMVSTRFAAGLHPLGAALLVIVNAGEGASYFARVVRLAFLSPTITTAICQGQHPATLTANKLQHVQQLPNTWTDQLAALASA